jgi:hypothetical protein
MILTLFFEVDSEFVKPLDYVILALFISLLFHFSMLAFLPCAYSTMLPRWIDSTTLDSSYAFQMRERKER